MTETTAKDRPKGTPTKILEIAAAVLLIGITIVVTLQIVCRYILQELPPWSEELSRYLFIWGNFLGAGVALARGSHVSIDSLITRLSPGVRGKLETVVSILITAFAVFLAYQGVKTAASMSGSTSITMHFSMGWIFAALPAAGFIFILYQLQKIFKRGEWGVTAGAALGVAALTVVLLLIGEYVPIPAGALVIAMVCVVILFIAVNTPISMAICLACLVYLLARGNIQLIIAPITIIGGMDSFVLLAVPLF
ncbi:MAG TPA: TRAP transporter small permease, partial [Thermodesulfobacteriota bacterium]|nr:TRAP transporter small permease [Thermodesulfobacteriota bacterium]